jgi:hypothetical protein
MSGPEVVFGTQPEGNPEVQHGRQPEGNPEVVFGTQGPAAAPQSDHQHPEPPGEPADDAEPVEGD